MMTAENLMVKLSRIGSFLLILVEDESIKKLREYILVFLQGTL